MCARARMCAGGGERAGKRREEGDEAHSVFHLKVLFGS